MPLISSIIILVFKSYFEYQKKDADKKSWISFLEKNSEVKNYVDATEDISNKLKKASKYFELVGIFLAYILLIILASSIFIFSKSILFFMSLLFIITFISLLITLYITYSVCNNTNSNLENNTNFIQRIKKEYVILKVIDNYLLYLYGIFIMYYILYSYTLTNLLNDVSLGKIILTNDFPADKMIYINIGAFLLCLLLVFMNGLVYRVTKIEFDKQIDTYAHNLYSRNFPLISIIIENHKFVGKIKELSDSKLLCIETDESEIALSWKNITNIKFNP